MRPRRILLTVGTVVVVAAAVVTVVVVTRTVRHDRPEDRHFEVNGQSLDCGTSGMVALDVYVNSAGPGASFTLDGRHLDAIHPPNDPQEYEPTPRPVFPCSDDETHHLHVDNGHGASPYYGCSIELKPAVQHRAGYNTPDFPAYMGAGESCDLTWTD